MCNVQRLLSPPNVHAVSTHIFSLVHQLRLLLAFTFIPLPLLFGQLHDMKSLFTGRLRIILFFAILIIVPLISESLLGLGTFSS